MINSGATRRLSTLNQQLQKVSEQVIKDIKTAGTYKQERVITSAQDTEIIVKGKKVINFCANNYLGLSNNPRVVKAA